jgi:mannose-1-phosphate guanylyltransferase
MDIGRDIAYHIRLVSKKETRKSSGPEKPLRAFSMPNPIYALILAGGSGERFWPLSRRARPKQLLRLVSKQTLLEQTLARLEGFVPSQRILILTNVEQEAAVRKILTGFPKENIVAEPAKRDTAAAVALGASWVAARDQAATMIVLPADHVIADRGAFQRTLALGVNAAEETGELVTIGVKPTWACPGFGYIEHGEPIHLRKHDDKSMIYRVLRFREKPNPELAESFLQKGNFRWNAGMFVWSVPTVLSEFNRHAPELAEFISQLRVPGNFEAVLRERFSKLPQISFDYAIMEKADRVLVVEAGFDWDDIGSWRALANYFNKDEQRNAANRAMTTVDSTDNILFDEGPASPGTIALLGVHNLIVVRTNDALLVCHRNQVENIKKLIAKLPRELQ